MDNHECAICLQKVDAAVVFDCARSGCASVYHAECARRALEMRGTCPVCRRRVSGDVVPISHFLHECARAQLRAEESCRAQVEALNSIIASVQTDVSALQRENELEKINKQNLLAELQVAFRDVRDNCEGTSRRLERLQTIYDKYAVSAEPQAGARCNIFLNAHVIAS